jgi:hypothetical protein
VAEQSSTGSRLVVVGCIAGAGVAFAIAGIAIIGIAFFFSAGATPPAPSPPPGPEPIVILNCDTADTSFMGLGGSRRTTVTAFNPRPTPVTAIIRIESVPSNVELGRLVVTIPAGNQGSGTVNFDLAEVGADRTVMCSVFSTY